MLAVAKLPALSYLILLTSHLPAFNRFCLMQTSVAQLLSSIIARRKEDFCSDPKIPLKVERIPGMPQSSVLFSDADLYKQYISIVMNGIESLPCLKNIELSATLIEDFYGHLMKESHFISAKK